MTAGFYFIPQALSIEEQFCWIRESLASFPQPPNRTNHNTVYGPINDLWTHVQKQHFLVEDNADNLVCSEDLPPERENRCPHADGVTAEPCDDRLISAGQPQALATETAHPDEHVGCKENAQTAGHDADVPPITVKDEACGARVIHEKPEEGRVRWRFVDEAEARGASIGAESGKPISAESLLRKLRWATIGQQFDWAKVLVGVSEQDSCPQLLKCLLFFLCLFVKWRFEVSIPVWKECYRASPLTRCVNMFCWCLLSKRPPLTCCGIGLDFRSVTTQCCHTKGFQTSCLNSLPDSQHRR